MSQLLLVTDGSSITANNEKGFDAASAFVIYKDNKLIYKESILLKNHTNNYAEMYAIYKGTKYITENIREHGSELLVITDSQLCEKSLNEWMRGWLKKTNNEILYSTTGKVINQELIKSAYINILSLALIMDVYVCHINSHKSEKDIPKMYQKFLDKYIAKQPTIQMDMETFRLIFEGNQIVDQMAYNELNSIN